MPNTRENLIDAIEKEKPYLPTEDYEVGYNNGLTMAQSIILATDINDGHKWISVKDRLPEYEQQVLTHRGESGVSIERMFPGAFWDFDYDIIDEVTHWMPLPEPPKGE